MILRKLLKNRGLGLNLVAGVCFISLLVNGWGLSWRELGGYLLVLLVLLGGLIGLAALCGWLLHKLMVRRNVPVDQLKKDNHLEGGETPDKDSKE